MKDRFVADVAASLTWCGFLKKAKGENAIAANQASTQFLGLLGLSVFFFIANCCGASQSKHLMRLGISKSIQTARSVQ